jgi:RimJ/RimL family protein N-acetyltransferase
VQRFTTQRLTARDWLPSDAEAAFAIYGDERVARWLGAHPRRPVASLADMQASVDRRVAQEAQHPSRYGLWPFELTGTGEMIGAILLSPLPTDEEFEQPGYEPSDQPAEVEIGWHLNPAHWGNGYATEAAGGIIELAFGEQYRLTRVQAVTDPDNVRSQAVCRRLGMTHLGSTDRYYHTTLEVFELIKG